jgi:hypothetical protein
METEKGTLCSISPSVTFVLAENYVINRGIFLLLFLVEGARGIVVVKALCCKPEGRGFKSR